MNCAIEIQRAIIERNAEVTPDKRIEFRIGIHLGDVVEESDGDLMGDGVNVAARLEGIGEPGGICLSEDAYRQVKSRLDLRISDLGPHAAEEHRRADAGLLAGSRHATSGQIATASPSGDAKSLQATLALRPARRSRSGSSAS